MINNDIYVRFFDLNVNMIYYLNQVIENYNSVTIF
jgi:hypothetical protein